MGKVIGILLFIFSLANAVAKEQVSIADDSGSTHTPVEITLAALEFPPLAYTQAGSSECIGYAIELARLIVEKYGHTLNAICAPAIRVYRLVQAGEIDMTINIKSTELLHDYVDFIEPEFGNLELIFLSHEQEGFENLISAIRGFDYHGYRQKFEAEDYVFQDTPGSIDAIKMFVRSRTRHLITYKAPFKFYLEQNGFELPPTVKIENLMELQTYFAVSRASKHNALIKEILQKHVEATHLKSFSELLPFY
ncbi:hypothetical protein QTP81_01595 [Alteromonas sp. ASW11-36]|uniref:Transporter substrate-binding domain-containing protein n=1 Tax=Alteromonas arenosi TaxID=3055817 RepID=A0ABT7SSY3_9ALTE|nr:hypothetical protein [Alteromonas sp. ASW11-36]MDM7859297.1 hypothetical protein [Alteromonas sp. ASW11-36]